MNLIRRQIIERLIRALLLLFTNQNSYTGPDIDKFVDQAVPLVRGAQRALAGAVAADMAARATAATGRPVPPPRIPDSAVVNLREGVDDTEVYRRPARALLKSLSAGDERDLAERKGSLRLEGIADLDMQMTYASASRAAMDGLPEGVRPEYWRRVLQGTESCALCVIASTQRYRRDRLNPIHPGCDCTVEAIFGQVSHVLDDDLLERAHAAVAELTGKSDRTGRDGLDYRHVLLSTVKRHGEVGDMLARPLHDWTGSSDLGR
ncbi:hypothetical protein [Actinomycetospora sp. CA-053990]|uniref:hypothetical protein n=1 Tax=Actinomycetospora sp. CA-053990 TaxID=3239891 RepID=UPI003D932FDF